MDFTTSAFILALIGAVNGHYQTTHPLHPEADTRPYTIGSPFWDNAAYHTANMEVVRLLLSYPEATITGSECYLPYSYQWAEGAGWQGATSCDTAAWRYDYGETPAHVLFGDWQICFQTYADLYRLSTLLPSHDTAPSHMIARARGVMEYEMAQPQNDFIWWADGLYMVMPTLTKLYHLTHDRKYLDKLFDYWTFAKNLMYDTDSHLFYRDAKYIFPKHKSANGLKDFWARGDGWVLAALAKVLQDLPAAGSSAYMTDYRADFTQTFCEMAAAVKACQQPEGYWTRSLLDAAHAPGPETSGTAFFTYALAWGVRTGVLNKEAYMPTLRKAWRYLTQTALQPDSTVGYVQPIGERAIPGQTVRSSSTANFGTGAFLLAACEMYRLARDREQQADYAPAVYVGIYPRRKDDLAWENQSAIYRAYGPALQRSGERAYGYDVWCKYDTLMVGDEFFERDFRGWDIRSRLIREGRKAAADSLEKDYSFHFDHGKGLDAYSVGPSLGPGTPALLFKGKLVYPWCYRTAEILSDGPDELAFRLTFDTVQIGRDRVVEHREIHARRGSRFNECDVWYEGLTKPCQVACGIVMHGHEASIVKDVKKKYFAYADPTDRPQANPSLGEIYIGIYMPSLQEVRLAEGHLLGLTTYQPGTRLRYYFGTGWSHGDCPTMTTMIQDLENILR